jgi:asparagine synthase (glutamine-hydrolysing)
LFAGVIVDPVNERLVLFNDRYGSERIYFCERPGMVFFASEAKALLSVLPESRALDDAGVADFLAYGCVRGGRTLFRGVELLPGGSILRFDRGHASERTRYFVPAEWEVQESLSPAAFSKAFEQSFAEVLPRYFSASERVGISITGGLDTRMIMACRPRPSIARCYTYAADRGETLDVALGRQIAQTCGLQHDVLRLGPDFLTRFGQHLDETVWVTDGCAGALGAHELPLSRLARELSTIRLTGNYGSEVLRGVSTYKPLGLSESLIHDDFGDRLAEARNAQTLSHPITRAAFEEIPEHLFGTLAAARAVLTVRTPYLDNALVRLAYAAPSFARRSTRSAVDLIAHRDPELALIPTDRGLIPAHPNGALNVRSLFEAVVCKLDYLHKEGLPGWMSGLEPAFRGLSMLGLLGRHKFLAYRRWFQVELAPYIREVLSDPRTAQMPYWNGGSLASFAEDHISGRCNHLKEIDAVLTLEAVQRVLLEGSQAVPDGAHAYGVDASRSRETADA